MKQFSLLVFLLIILALTGCGRKSLEDFRLEGEDTARSLLHELRKIRTREQLIQSSSKLQRLFNEMADIIIVAHEFRQKHPNLERNSLPANHELNSQLRTELNRIYKIEGGRQIIEKCEAQALETIQKIKTSNFN